MKLVMIVCARDEADIISQNIRFHLDHGVDHVLALDNGSVDGTRELLADLETSYPVTVFDEPGKDHSQGRWMTRLAQVAKAEHRADWILPNDADEFWWCGGRCLKEAIAEAAQDKDTNTLNCARRNLFDAYDASLEVPWHRRLVHRPFSPMAMQHIAVDRLVSRDAPHFYSALPGKVMLRAEGLSRVSQGNHTAEYAQGVSAADSDISIFHYPIRSPEQFVFKTLNGGDAYARNEELPARVGWHKRRWYWLYQNCGLTVALQDALPSQSRLEKDLGRNVLTKDETLIHALDRYFPGK